LQVVVPKALEEPEDDSSDFYADDDHYGAYSDSSASGRVGDDVAALERWRKRQAEPVHRAARPAPEPTECHALGSLSNVSWGLIVTGKPELGIELRYRGGDDCLKRVVRKRQAGDPPPSSALPEVSWVAVPRQLTLRLRCDPTAPGGIDPFDPAAAMQLARRVRVVEAEMCEYEAEWPTSAACPTIKPHVTAIVAAKARKAAFPAVLALGLAAAVVTQAARHRRTLRALGRRIKAGDRGALRAVLDVLVSKVRASLHSSPKRAKLTRCRGAERVGGVAPLAAPLQRRPRDLMSLRAVSPTDSLTAPRLLLPASLEPRADARRQPRLRADDARPSRGPGTTRVPPSRLSEAVPSALPHHQAACVPAAARDARRSAAAAAVRCQQASHAPLPPPAARRCRPVRRGGGCGGAPGRLVLSKRRVAGQRGARRHPFPYPWWRRLPRPACHA
jgi:hypothetical protein